MVATKPFLAFFCEEVQRAYLRHSPGLVRSTSAHLDQSEHSLIFHFEIAHPRDVDQIDIRFIGRDVTIDYLPGTSCIPFCLKDSHSLRWIALDFSTACNKLSDWDKQQVVKATTAIYELAQQYREELRSLLLGKKALAKEVRS